MTNTERFDPADEQVAALLDQYLTHLQEQDHEACERLLAEHPELASWVACLGALDELAPERTSDYASVTTSNLSSGSVVLPAGTLFGDYELQGEVGRGGMGIVYRAKQLSLQRDVALKMILAAQSATEEQVRRFSAEARAAARVSHPGIVRIIDAGVLDGTHFFAMELVDGPSLAERVQQGALPADEAVRLIIKVARAVEHLHAQGIIHRDLKPSNILLERGTEPVITDFGLAKLLAPGASVTATGVIAGTPSYMAPEQAAGRPAEVGPAADVYSLGAVLYELLTGRPPFVAEGTLDTLVQVLGKEPTAPRKLNSRISVTLENVILRCLEKSPRQRFASAGALADELERFLRGESLESDAPDLGRRFWRWIRREPALSLHLLALLAFLFVAQLNYHLLGAADSRFHWSMVMLLGSWAFLTLAVGPLLQLPGWGIRAGFVWATIDAVLLSVAIYLANSAASPLVVCYPLLIVGSGLWFRVRLVWYTTFLCVAMYLLLAVELRWMRPHLAAELDVGVDHHVIMVATLISVGAISAYQVFRIRTLSRYFQADDCW